jgi:hypothetical protein
MSRSTRIRPPARLILTATAVLVLALGGAPSRAQTSAADSPPLTLQRAFEQAWERQPEARALAQRRDASPSPQAGGARPGRQSPRRSRPRSAATGFNARQGCSQELEFGVAVPLWLPGERQRTQDLAARVGPRHGRARSLLVAVAPRAGSARRLVGPCAATRKNSPRRIPAGRPVSAWRPTSPAASRPASCPGPTSTRRTARQPPHKANTRSCAPRPWRASRPCAHCLAWRWMHRSEVAEDAESRARVPTPQASPHPLLQALQAKSLACQEAPQRSLGCSRAATRS